MKPVVLTVSVMLVVGCGNALKATGELDADTDPVDDGTDGAIGCTSDEECDDGNPCNGSETCGEDGECDPGTPLSDGAPCEEDGVEGTCRDEECVPVTCGDGDLDAGEECDDGNATSGDGCEDTCRFSCHEDSECSDDNVCTDDVCEEGGTGRICAHENNTAECDDGNPCTEGDTCSGGTCTSGTNTCECETTEDCAEHEDGDLCNGTLVCSPETHTCVVDPATVVTCPPTSTVCHQLECVPSTGLCEDDNPAEGTACEDDLDACTDDVCDGAGSCTHPAITCTDGNVCTDDSCNSSTGCVFTNNTAPCDDGNACTADDHCAGGTCHGGMGIACNDRNQCTDDSCDTATGCVFTPHTRGCDDGDPCTTGDVCDGAGHCVGTDLPLWYLDGDGDGYGDTSTEVCAATAPTSDYVSIGGDCCDDNTSVNPGVTGWFTVVYECHSTPVDFDWNCSGVEEQRWTSIGSCSWDSATGTCVHVAGWQVGSGMGPPACGHGGSWLGGCMMGGPGVCNNGAVTSRLQQCH